MGLHLLANDHSLVEHHGERYQCIGRYADRSSDVVAYAAAASAYGVLLLSLSPAG